MKRIYSLGIWFISRMRHNLFLKVLSLLISISIWLWVEVNEEKNISAKLAISYNFPEDLVEVAEAPKAILVELQGPKGRIRQLNDTILHTTIDLIDSIEGTNNIDLSVQKIDNIPEGVSIARFSPPVLDIDLDKPMVRDVPVRPNIVGTPAKGWKIDSISIEPQSVAIRGARQLLQNITDITTEVINVDQIGQSRTFRPLLSLPSKTLIAQNEQKVAVTVKIATTDLKREIKEVAVQFNSPDKILEPTLATIIISFPEEKLQKIPENPVLFVDEKKLQNTGPEIRFINQDNSPFSIQGLEDIEIEIIEIIPPVFTIRENNDEE